MAHRRSSVLALLVFAVATSLVCGSYAKKPYKMHIAWGR